MHVRCNSTRDLATIVAEVGAEKHASGFSRVSRRAPGIGTSLQKDGMLRSLLRCTGTNTLISMTPFTAVKPVQSPDHVVGMLPKSVTRFQPLLNRA